LTEQQFSRAKVYREIDKLIDEGKSIVSEYEGTCPKCGRDLDLCTCSQEATPYSINRRD
jgi:hypothetical protein